jgi:3-methyladenine DNA glycosylase/8-oxoguanine DNA glycosylase
VPAREIPLDRPLDLARTVGLLVRGRADRTIRVAADGVWWTTRTAAGPATLRLRQAGGRLVADGFGPGGEAVLAAAPRLAGLASVAPAQLVASGHRVHPLLSRLARRFPGVRLPRTEAVLDALIPAILEQKVTGTEAHRAWRGLVRAFGEPAPGPLGDALWLSPSPRTLARQPYYAFHPFGVERRRAELIRRVAAEAAWFEAIVDLAPADAQARLRSVPGVGPWTAAEVAVRALGDADAVSVGDFHLPNLVGWALAGEPRGDDARMLELLEPYRGRRAMVVRLLELSGIYPPRYGPRLAPRRIEAI